MLVRSGAPSVLELHARETGHEKLNSLSVSIAEPQLAVARWTLKVEAMLFGRNVTRELGRVDTIAPAVTQTPSRVVAIASCPGCAGFRVSVELHPDVATAHECNVELGELPDLHAAPGLVAIEPHAILHGQRYAYLSAVLGAGATVVPIPANQRVQTVSAIAFAAGGTMAVAGGAAIPLPANVGVQLAPRGTLRGPVNVNFAAIPAAGADYIIELTT